MTDGMDHSSFEPAPAASVDAPTDKENPFENMFPDGDEDLKLQVKDLQRQLFERDQEEITRRRTIAELQEEIQDQAIEIEMRRAMDNARIETVNQWCDRAESFGVSDIEGLTAVSNDYKALRVLMNAEPAQVFNAVERLKMELVAFLNGKAEIKARRIREAAIAFRHASRPELDNRTMSQATHEMDNARRALDAALAE